MNSYVLGNSYLDTSEFSELLSKPWDFIPNLEDLHIELPDCNSSLEMLVMDNNNIDIVAAFFYEGYDKVFENVGFEERYELVNCFYQSIKDNMGISCDLQFAFFDDPLIQGNYDDKTNTITLNANYLENPDCKDLLSTIIHESRHAFQEKECSDNLNGQSMVPEDVRNLWANNLEHYISPEFDIQAYREQPIEKDAYDYENIIMERGLSVLLV